MVIITLSKITELEPQILKNFDNWAIFHILIIQTNIFIKMTI